ncbi:MAG: YggS family pyridoxal phosphate-dependent enzyme [bacterium]|nr:YggS family pyridoxal phosphate-dependent enzyme [bacterium]
MSSIPERLLETLQQIEQAAQGRPVTLVAVSKTHPIEALLQAYQAGQRIFGENKVQEARDKAPLLPEDAELHLIGPLQSNKAKYCPDLFSWVHSLDRLEVAEKLSQKCAEKGQNLKVLVQVNLSGEASKFGLGRADELLPFCEAILKLPHLELKGLMTIGHPGFDEAGNRRLFAQLRELRQSTASKLGLSSQMDQLSMGMSHDWQAALEEGATMLRIGSAIFGAR